MAVIIKRGYTVIEEEQIAEYSTSLDEKCNDIASFIQLESFDKIVIIGHRTARLSHDRYERN
ncbi:hypothetical protein ACFL60_03855 [Candidatus Omnitrophota bacterium]